MVQSHRIVLNLARVGFGPGACLNAGATDNSISITRCGAATAYLGFLQMALFLKVCGSVTIATHQDV